MRSLLFENVIKDVTSKFKKIKKCDYSEIGSYKIIDQGQRHIAGYTNDVGLINKKITPVIIFGDHTRIIKYENSPIALGADGAKALWVDPEIAHTDYVYQYLKSVNIKPVGYSRHFKFLKEIKIPIPYKDGKPNIKYQIRIATLLGDIESLITTRKQNLLQLDDFLKSTFVEIFGNPVRNEKGWQKKQVGKLLSALESGWSPKCEAYKAGSDDWGVLKLGAVTKCHFNSTENKALPSGISPKPEKEIKEGDLLFTRKNTYELVAACAYVFETRPNLMMPDLIFRLVIKDKEEIHPLYLWKLLVNPRQRGAIQALAGGAAGSMPNISKQKLKETHIPVPPIELQNKFATIIEKTESIKKQYQQNLTELENLYGTLSQKAFKGELDISKIPLENDAQELPPIQLDRIS